MININNREKRNDSEKLKNRINLTINSINQKPDIASPNYIELINLIFDYLSLNSKYKEKLMKNQQKEEYNHKFELSFRKISGVLSFFLSSNQCR